MSNIERGFFVFVFFGLVAVMGSYYVQAGELNLLPFLGAIPIGLLATNILVVNNYRDAETDRKGPRRALPSTPSPPQEAQKGGAGGLEYE